MTETELRDLASIDLVRLVMKNKNFHLVTLDHRFCNPGAAPVAMIGHVACWCLTEAKWIKIDPAAVFAFETLGHTAENAVIAGDALN